MPQGLTAFLLPLGPEMWHEFALGPDFRDPRAPFDLLLAAHTITTQPDCDRATALLILAKAVEAGFLRAEVPAAFDGRTARAFVQHLSAALTAGRFAAADLALPAQAEQVVETALRSLETKALLSVAMGRQSHRPPFGFAGWRPVRHPEPPCQTRPLAA